MPNGVASMAHILKSLAIFGESRICFTMENRFSLEQESFGTEFALPSAQLVFHALRIA
jgi:hypothetical protein